MKNAPNLKKQPADLMEESIIFAGADAWTFAKAWQEMNPIGDTVPPVVLDKKQLAELYVQAYPYMPDVVSRKQMRLHCMRLRLTSTQTTCKYTRLECFQWIGIDIDGEQEPGHAVCGLGMV